MKGQSSWKIYTKFKLSTYSHCFLGVRIYKIAVYLFFLKLLLSMIKFYFMWVLML